MKPSRFSCSCTSGGKCLDFLPASLSCFCFFFSLFIAPASFSFFSPPTFCLSSLQSVSVKLEEFRKQKVKPRGLLINLAKLSLLSGSNRVPGMTDSVSKPLHLPFIPSCLSVLSTHWPGHRASHQELRLTSSPAPSASSRPVPKHFRITACLQIMEDPRELLLV